MEDKEKTTISIQIKKETADLLEGASIMLKKDLQELYSEAIEDYAKVFEDTLKLLQKF